MIFGADVFGGAVFAGSSQAASPPPPVVPVGHYVECVGSYAAGIITGVYLPSADPDPAGALTPSTLGGFDIFIYEHSIDETITVVLVDGDGLAATDIESVLILGFTFNAGNLISFDPDVSGSSVWVYDNSSGIDLAAEVGNCIPVVVTSMLFSDDDIGLTLPYNIGTNNGPLFVVTAGTTLETIESNDFFSNRAGYASILKTGDVLLVNASDGTKMYNLTVEKEVRSITLSTGIVII